MRWGRRAAEREERLAGLQAQLSRVEEHLQTLSEVVERQHDQQRTAAERVEDQLERDLRPLLLALARDDAGNRRRLFAVRDSPEYPLAYTEPEPLVSVVIPATAKRVELLVQRALPSALNQTYGNLEVIVVGDAAGPGWRAAVGRIKDPRIRCADLTQRFVHPDPQRHWMTASTMARNEAHRLVRGRWIAELDDDDALRPHAVSSLLRLARAESLEVAYGIMERHDVNGETEPLGRFPPGPGEPNWRQLGLPHQPWDGTAACGSLVHAGLRIFAREHVAAEVPAAGDFFRVERMLRAGVRFGMLPEVVYDYFPSLLWERPAPVQDQPRS